jgi:hypothetical protein
MLSALAGPEQVCDALPPVADLTSGRPCGSLACSAWAGHRPWRRPGYPAGRRCSCPTTAPGGQPVPLPPLSRLPAAAAWSPWLWRWLTTAGPLTQLPP